MESPWPPPGCWSCGTLPREEVLRHQSVLQARTAAEGGPFTRFLCPDCGLETVVEEVPGGDPVLAPPEPGNAALSAFLDGKEGFRVRSRARSWFLRWGEALEELRRYRAVTRRAGGRPPEPGPARGRRRGGREKDPPREEAPPPPPPPPGPPEAVDLPRTAAAARRILGVAAGATAAEVDAAYRRASRRCHPDLVSHLDEDFQRLAHAKFLRVHAARELLKRAGGTPPPPASSNPGRRRP